MGETEYHGQIVDPTWETGSVNVNSLQEILLTLSSGFPFLDETTKRNFEAQILGIGEAKNPHEAPEVAAANEKDAEIERLKAALAEAQGSGGHDSGQGS